MSSHKVNALMEECRKLVTPEIQKQVDLCVAIANRVYDLLEQKGMSQKDLAKKLGKTETEVSRWLSGTHNLTLATIAKLSVALDDDIIMTTGKQIAAKNYKYDNEIESSKVADDSSVSFEI